MSHPCLPPAADAEAALLASVLDRLPAPDIWSPRAAFGPAGGEALPFLRLCNGEDGLLDRQITRETADCPGADRKVGAAYFMDAIGWALGSVLGHLYLHDLVVDPDPGALALEPRDVHWTHEGQSGIGRAWTVRLLPPCPALRRGCPGDPAFRMAFEDSFARLVAPLAEGLHAASGLSRPALWRLAGDGLVLGLIEPARALGRTALLPAEAEALSARQGGRFFARQRRIVELVLPADPARNLPESREIWRARGGCCRAYTWGDNGYCSTCVHLAPEEQIRRWQDWQEGQRAAAAAAGPEDDPCPAV